MRRTLLLALVLFLLAPVSLTAQQPRPGYVDPLELSGPRVGITALFGPVADSLRDEHGISPILTQFGWQIEHRFYSGADGLTGITELVILAGGLEQGVLIPSLTGIVGVRSGRGTELGVGPALSAAGIGLAIAGGITLRSGDLNFPINLAVVPAENGTRLSLLSGFNMRRRSGGGGGGWRLPGLWGLLGF
ncbi:MAG: hypothetical protein M3483_00400 [Gemmatimonadota bacterium]|nr:hypothetical protein [Gemmatimonadota bacterium]